jgi:DNA-binding transcriptional ArsR family regulator
MTATKSKSRRRVKVGISQRIGPWDVVLNWPDDPDQGGPVSMTIKAADDATDDELIGGLSSHVLRQIDFRAARDGWLNLAAFRAELGVGDGMRWRSENLQRILDTEGVSEGYLGYLAEAYVLLVRSGEQSVAAKLAEMTGRSRDTVRQHLHRVRKAGMLTTVPGKAGGQLTAKAIMAVRQATEGLGSEDSESELEFAEQLAAELADA